MKLAVLEQATQHVNQSLQPPIIHHSSFFNNLSLRRTYHSTNTIKGTKNKNGIIIHNEKALENKEVKNTQRIRNQSNGQMKSWRKKVKDNKEFNMTGNKIFNMRKFFQTKNQTNFNQTNHFDKAIKMQNIFSEKSSPNKYLNIQRNSRPLCQSYNSFKITKNSIALRNSKLSHLLMPNKSHQLSHHQLGTQKQNYRCPSLEQRQSNQTNLQQIKNPQLAQSRSQITELQKLKPMFTRQTLMNFQNAQIQNKQKCIQKEKYGNKFRKCQKKAYNYNCYRYMTICYSEFNNDQHSSNNRYKTPYNGQRDQHRNINTQKQEDSPLPNPNSHSLSPSHICLTPFNLSPKLQMKKHISRISQLMARKYCSRYRPRHGLHNLHQNAQ